MSRIIPVPAPHVGKEERNPAAGRRRGEEALVDLELRVEDLLVVSFTCGDEEDEEDTEPPLGSGSQRPGPRRVSR